MKFLQNCYSEFLIVFYTASMGILSSGYIINRLRGDKDNLTFISLTYFVLFSGLSALVAIIVLIDLKPKLEISFHRGLGWFSLFSLLVLFDILSFIITTITLITSMWALAAYIH